MLVAGCGAKGGPEPQPESSPVSASAASPGQAVPSPPTVEDPQTTPSKPTSLAVPREGYDPKATMVGIFSGTGHSLEETLTALDEARLNGDALQVPVIIELMRFFASEELSDKANQTLTALTGNTVTRGIEEWNDWMVWLGKNSSRYPPPDAYVEWKINLLSLIDPRFRDLLAQADQTSRIDLTEVVWGGVPVDGIPDLLNSPTVDADDARYLLRDDVVFGVSINGEHRAYPRRILNPHEMANDTLGGEPISLAY